MDEVFTGTQRRGVEEDVTAAQPPGCSSGEEEERPRSVIAEWGDGTSRAGGPAISLPRWWRPLG